ncbi:MAG: hypothetical protein ACUZ8I_06720 [Candidatus Scalindua sp.]
MKEYKKDILEIADIANKCPEKLQEICFELLLEKYLETKFNPQQATPPPQKDDKKDNTQEEKGDNDEHPEQSEIVKSSLHLKARKFMEKNSVTIEEINNLYYKEDDDILPLFEDLKTTRTAESQIRIALLRCLKNALNSGEFKCEIEDIRDEANTRKSYDSKNWSNNFKNNATLFDFDKFSKTVKSIKLSEAGKAELSAVIKELQ